MAFFRIIPVTKDPHQLIPVILDGVSYQIQLLWNGRSNSWSMAIYNAATELLVGSIRAVANFPLLKYFTDLELPQGDLRFWDQSGAGIDPGRDDLGTRVLLVYEEEEL